MTWESAVGLGVLFISFIFAYIASKTENKTVRLLLTFFCFGFILLGINVLKTLTVDNAGSANLQFLLDVCYQYGSRLFLVMLMFLTIYLLFTTIKWAINLVTKLKNKKEVGEISLEPLEPL